MYVTKQALVITLQTVMTQFLLTTLIISSVKLHKIMLQIGSGDADFTQNNNIPTINQVIDAENDCDQSDEQTASGSNFASCSNSDPENTIDSITQDNEASGTHVDDIFQDNTGSFSQVMTLNNGCDATTFTDSGDNYADCANDLADNHWEL